MRSTDRPSPNMFRLAYQSRRDPIAASDPHETLHHSKTNGSSKGSAITDLAPSEKIVTIRIDAETYLSLKNKIEIAKKCYQEKKYKETSDHLLSVLDTLSKIAPEGYEDSNLVVQSFLFFHIGLAFYHQYHSSHPSKPDLFAQAKKYIHAGLCHAMTSSEIPFTSYDFICIARCLNNHDARMVEQEKNMKPEDLPARIEEAKALEKKGEIQEAIQLYNHLIYHFPLETPLFLYRSWIERYQKMTSDAADHWMRLWVFVLIYLEQRNNPEKNLQSLIREQELKLLQIEKKSEPPNADVFNFLYAYYSLGHKSFFYSRAKINLFLKEENPRSILQVPGLTKANISDDSDVCKEIYEQKYHMLVRTHQMLYRVHEANEISPVSRVIFLASILEDDALPSVEEMLTCYRNPAQLTLAKEKVLMHYLSPANNVDLLLVTGLIEVEFGYIEEAKVVFEHALNQLDFTARFNARFTDREKHIIFCVLNDAYERRPVSPAIARGFIQTGEKLIEKFDQENKGTYIDKAEIAFRIGLSSLVDEKEKQERYAKIVMTAEKYCENKDYVKGIFWFRQAIRLMPLNPEIYRRLCQAFSEGAKNINDKIKFIQELKNKMGDNGLMAIGIEQESTYYGGQLQKNYRARAERYYYLWIAIILMTKGFDGFIQELMNKIKENPNCLKHYYDLLNYALAASYYYLGVNPSENTSEKYRPYQKQCEELTRTVLAKFKLEAKCTTLLGEDIRKTLYYLYTCDRRRSVHPVPLLTAQSLLEEKRKTDIKHETIKIENKQSHKEKRQQKKAAAKRETKEHKEAPSVAAFSLAEENKNKIAEKKRRNEEKKQAAEALKKRKKAIKNALKKIMDRTFLELEERKQVRLTLDDIVDQVATRAAKQEEEEKAKRTFIIEANDHPTLHYWGMQISALQKSFPNGVIAIVGGAAREVLLKKKTDEKLDVDLVTSLEFEDLQKSVVGSKLNVYQTPEEKKKKSDEKKYSTLNVTVPDDYVQKEIQGRLLTVPKLCHSPKLKEGFIEERRERPLRRDGVFGIFSFENNQLKITFYGKEGMQDIDDHRYQLTIDDPTLSDEENFKHICEAFKADPLWIERLIRYSTEEKGNIDRYRPMIQRLAAQDKDLFKRTPYADFQKNLKIKLGRLNASPNFYEFCRQYETLGLMKILPHDAKSEFLKPKNSQSPCKMFQSERHHPHRHHEETNGIPPSLQSSAKFTQ